MLNQVIEKEKLRWYEAPEVLEDLNVERKRRNAHLLEVKESVKGAKEEFDLEKYMRLRYWNDEEYLTRFLKRLRLGEIDEVLRGSIEEDYYLGHPELSTIADFAEFNELHESDT